MPLPLFALNIAGWIASHWRLIAVVGGILVLFIATALIVRSCKPKPKFNEKEIQAAQKAVAEQNRKEMVEVLTQSDVREKAIDANVAYAESKKLDAIQESRTKYNGLSNEELAAEIEARK